MKRRFRIRAGSILQVSLKGDRFGYCRALRKDEFGWLFEVYKTRAKVPLEVKKVVRTKRLQLTYINEASFQEEWQLVGIFPPENLEIPPIFNGHPKYFWTLYSEEDEARMDAAAVSYDEMLQKGYVPKTLWLAEHVKDAIGRQLPLKWDWKKVLGTDRGE